MTEEVTILKAFCDEKRLQIIQLLSKKELCACDLLDQLDVSQSGLSYQMKILIEANIVTSRQEGKWVHYQINPQGVEQAIQIIQHLTGITE